MRRSDWPPQRVVKPDKIVQLMEKRLFWSLAAGGLLLAAGLGALRAEACTGITLRAADGSQVVARTIEWGGSDLNSRYVVTPRGYAQHSFAPDGGTGMSFTARYGYVGLAVERPEFVAEGLNEEGLSAGLFYFPGYGRYVDFDAAQRDVTIADLQVVPWILGSCRTLDEVRQAVARVRIVSVYPGASTVHWRFTDPSGSQLVLEIVDGQAHFYENRLGVLTNSPGFEWQMTNLCNYVNLHGGSAPGQSLDSVALAPFGAGSGMLGLPGDVTPPSRFVRAAFYQATAPRQATGEAAVRCCFQILNNFDIPIGVEFAAGQQPTDIPSATQWTAAADLTHRRLYYRTMYDSAIRCFDLTDIDFARVKYRSEPLDRVREQPVTPVRVR